MKVTTAISFADLRAALHNELNEEVCGKLLTTAARKAALQHVGFDSCAIALFEELHVDGPALLRRQGLSTEWLTLVADWRREVWCRVRGKRRPIQPRTGMRPVDPIADLICACGYAVLRCEFASLLREHVLLRSVAAPCGGDCSSSSAAGDECLVEGCRSTTWTTPW